MLEDLYFYVPPHSQPGWKADIANGLWLELLHPFTAVKNLYLSEQFALRIGPALQELVEGRTTEVFPTLQNIFLKGLQPSGPVQEGIGKFVASRQVINLPIAITSWDNADSELDGLDSEVDSEVDSEEEEEEFEQDKVLSLDD
jgi:hypothetical protein